MQSELDFPGHSRDIEDPDLFDHQATETVSNEDNWSVGTVLCTSKISKVVQYNTRAYKPCEAP